MADIHYQNTVYIFFFLKFSCSQNLSDHYWCLNVHWYLANKVTDTYNISGRCDQTEITNRRFMVHSVGLLGLSHVGLSLVKHTLLIFMG